MRRPAGLPILPEMTALDLSADAGLIAIFLATANLCLGLLIAVRYSPRRSWPHRRLDIFALHNRTAYLLLASILIHPVILLFSCSVRWRLLDIALPAWSPVQPLETSFGAAGLYLIVVVVVTSYFRVGLGRRRWKQFHYLVYAAAVCVFLHGILADPRLQGMAIDPFDGEKLFVESCLLFTMLAAAWAWRHRRREPARG
jgi:predicted ferric reductase